MTIGLVADGVSFLWGRYRARLLLERSYGSFVDVRKPISMLSELPTTRLQLRIAPWMTDNANATLLCAGGLPTLICSFTANSWINDSPTSDQFSSAKAFSDVRLRSLLR